MATTKKKGSRAASNTNKEKLANVKGKQEFVVTATSKNKKKPRTWVIVYKLLTGPEVNMTKSAVSRKRLNKRKAEKAKAKKAKASE